MGVLTFAGRIVLVVINIVFILLSLALIVAGFVIRFAHDWLRPKVSSVLEEIESKVQSAYGNSNFSMDDFEFGSLVGTLCYVMIAVGVVLLAIAFLGCFGACCSFTTIMLVYTIILVALLVGQVVLVILVFGAPDTIKVRIKESLEDTMGDYDGIQGTSVSAMGWNWMQQEYKCCGADDYQGFQNKGSTYKASNANDNAAIGGSNGNVEAPVACCKTLPSTAAERDTCAGNGAAPSETDSNLNTGCVDKVWEAVVEDNTVYFGLAVGFCFAFQIVLIFFAILVYKNRGVTGGLV